MVERLFLAVPLGCLRFVIVVFPDHTHLLLLISVNDKLVSPFHDGFMKLRRREYFGFKVLDNVDQ